MQQGFNPEVDAGLGKVSEVTQDQVEQFQEQLRAAQAALAQLQKEEGRSKKKDTALAALLSRFVKSNKDQDILKLIVYCLNLGIPVNFIVAILSLGFEEIYMEVSHQLKKEMIDSVEEQDKKFLNRLEQEEQKDLENTKKEFDEHKLPQAVKARINEWVKDILLLSLENKEKTISTVYEHGAPHLSPLQLTTKMLERYLASVHIEGAFERIKAFSEFILKGIQKELIKHK